MSSAVAGHKRSRDTTEQDEVVDHSLEGANKRAKPSGGGGGKKGRPITYIQLVENFAWGRVNFEKIKRVSNFKKVPLSIKNGERTFQGPMVQFNDVKMPYPPKIVVNREGKPSCELTITVGDVPACQKFCDDADETILANAKKNRIMYFKEEDRDDIFIERGRRPMSQIAWKKYVKDENDESHPVVEMGRYPNVLKMNIPLDKTTHEPSIRFVDKDSGEELAMEDLQGGSTITVLGKMHCQWFNGNKFGVKPTATLIAVSSGRESYNDYDLLSDGHVKLALSGETAYDADGKLKEIPKDQGSDDEEGGGGGDANDAGADGFINTFGER